MLWGSRQRLESKLRLNFQAPVVGRFQEARASKVFGAGALVGVPEKGRGNVADDRSGIVRALSNTDGLNTSPANPYNYAGEYGPSLDDVRNEAMVGGSFERWSWRVSPFLILRSGAPFDITAGRDLFGDTLFNGRPGIASNPNQPGVIATTYGLIDPNPSLGEPLLPRNFGRGPAFVMLNLRLGKTIEFGATEGANAASGQSGNSRSEHKRYSLSFFAHLRNILNHKGQGRRQK